MDLFESTFSDDTDFKFLYTKLIERQREDNSLDDLLYFVQSNGKVIIQRLDQTMQEYINWKQSFYLNLISHLEYKLESTLVTSQGRELINHTKCIFASPFEITDDKHHPHRMTYPDVCFQADFGEQKIPLDEGNKLIIRIYLDKIVLFEDVFIGDFHLVEEKMIPVHLDCGSSIIYQVNPLRPIRLTVKTAINSLLSNHGPYRRTSPQHLCQPLLIKIPITSIIDHLLTQMVT